MSTTTPAPTAGQPYYSPRHAGRPRRLVLRAAAAITAVWVAVVWTSPHIDVGPEVHRLALFCHLAALVVGFGAVLAMDWLGLQWMLRRLDLPTLLRTTHNAHLLVWLGLAGLVASGALLGPNIGAGQTRVKLVAVLAVALNGLYVGRLQHRLGAYTESRPPWTLLAAGGLASLVSQAGWWTATAVGFLSAQS
ncbi:hypothetical protein [Phytohabitans houttuyneae]|uniref:DUF2231 domain-containing protein n=1 Tax=Phytohabitans houttuyneae TaxID=1076126 RepID=A0A6V8KUC1_9ACTN|nr:hypothetical protein [Phytohabitans houttuyneae]GFJ84195.1 hypothetical protein Phou_083750 [Phytohabitans houttuyneae]